MVWYLRITLYLMRTAVRQLTTGAESHIDHFIVSRNLLDCVKSVVVYDVGSNLSDHCPVMMKCVLPVLLTVTLIRLLLKLARNIIS